MNKELIVDAKVENLDCVLAFSEEALEELECPPKIIIKMDICVEELFVNIASYGYPDTEGTAEIRITSEEPGSVTYTFLDSGIPYNPLARPDPDTTLSAEERGIGGYGVYIVKKSVDEVSYRHEGGKNILSFTKKF